MVPGITLEALSKDDFCRCLKCLVHYTLPSRCLVILALVKVEISRTRARCYSARALYNN